MITVRYWAGAKAAAGTDRDVLVTDSSLTVADVVARAVDLHPDSRLGEVVKACSVLVDEQPLGTRDPTSVEVLPGQSVELLPPFAGG
ncbi:MoaD/ThiS family protein [Nocardioides sp. GY 10127]|nr:MoaD/ThiS family protein [Nocardioides sp. GY 10127]